MSDTANEITKLREALQDTLNSDTYPSTATIQLLRKVLAETEPKHPAVVAWEEWLGEDYAAEPKIQRPTFLAGYKAGLGFAADMADGRFADGEKHPPCFCDKCKLAKRIRDAAEKCPVT